jgi:heme/copper-type cytochrome/quinol oxidase subunit 2
MFELYKKRDLSANFSDTTTFFKIFGKHYFKNYFIINGTFLMLLVVLIYFFAKVYMEVIFSGISNPQKSTNLSMTYFNDNLPLIVGSFIVAFLLIIILSMLSISFPVVYFKLFEKTNDDSFSTKQIISGLKQNI